MNDEKLMKLALSLAGTAELAGDVPVGALILQDDCIISTGFNQRESHRSATAHAEIIAIERACQRLKSWRLHRCTLITTLEPCIMCAGAILQARIPRVVIGTPDPKGGGFGGVYRLHDDDRLNHKVDVKMGVLQQENRELLQNFFRKRRK